MCTHNGQRERTQQPPPPTAHFALNHRDAVWSPFRTGGALRAPAEKTKADRQEDNDGDRAATAHGQLQNSRVNSAIPDFKVECDKIESKLRRLVLEYNDMSDRKREKKLDSLHWRAVCAFTQFFEAYDECG